MGQKSIRHYDEIGPGITPAVHGAIIAARAELGLPHEEAIETVADHTPGEPELI